MTDFEDWAPRVWVGCLACYNGGMLIGAWYDVATDNVADLTPMHVHVAAQNDRLEPTDWAGHEELWVMDHEDWHGLISGECSPMEAQATYDAVSDALTTSCMPVEALAAWASNIGADREDWGQASDYYYGEHESLEDYAEECVEEGLMGEVPDWLAGYIDISAIARDMECEGYWTEPAPGGGVYVFTP